MRCQANTYPRPFRRHATSEDCTRLTCLSLPQQSPDSEEEQDFYQSSGSVRTWTACASRRPTPNRKVHRSATLSESK